jgi:hypothetical protein
VQQTLRGTTHTKKQKTTKEPIKRKWKKQYLNKEGNITKLKPTPESTVAMSLRVKSKKHCTARKKRSSTLKMVYKVGAIPTYEM